jgi:hypothetical protein
MRCGGRVLLAAHFTPNAGAPFDGTIEINCQIRGINLNKHVMGDNVFIKT